MKTFKRYTLTKTSDTVVPEGIVWPFSIYMMVAACFGAAFSLLYPGIMSYDSIYTYKLSETLRLDDWNPPAYTLLTRYLRWIVDSPASVLAFNLALFTVGCLLLAELVRRRNTFVGHLVPLILFLPFVINFVGVLWKDVALAVCWWAAAGIALYTCVGRGATGIGSKWKTYLTIGSAGLLLALGVLSRHNAVVVAPFMIATLSFAVLRPSKIGIRWLTSALALAALLSAAILMGGTASIDRIYGVTKAHPFSSLVTYDLAGITRNSGINAFPVAFTQAEVDEISGCYQLNDWNSYGDKCPFVPQKLQKEQWWGTSSFTRHWLKQIWLFPGAYLKHRFQYFFFFLRLGYEEGYYIVHPGGIDENDLGLRHPEHWAFRVFVDYVRWFQGWPVMKPWFWLLASFALIAYWSCRRDYGNYALIGLLVSASSFSYILSYLFIGVAADFRYIYWSILGTLFSSILLLVRPADALPDPTITTRSRPPT
jgi:hypothetical protein